MTRYQDKLWTFQDAVDRVLDTFDLRPEGRDLRQAKQAVLKVNREIAAWHDWQWLMTALAFETEAPYDTGTIQYTASTRTLSLTGGTWPANAAYGEVVIGDRRYLVESRSSDTVLILKSGFSPSADIAANTVYKWVRVEYELPAEVRKNIDLLDHQDSSTGFSLQYVPEACAIFVSKSIYYRFSTLFSSNVPIAYWDKPNWFTIGRSDKYASGYSVKFAQIPSSARPYTLYFWRDPRRLKYYKQEFSGSVLNDTVQWDGFTQDHVGSIVRISEDNAHQPTSIWGGFGDDDSADGLSPFEFQGTITSVSGTTATIDIDTGISSAEERCCVSSDPLDIDHEVMLSAFLAAADYNFSVMQRRDDTVNWLAEQRREISLAKESDEDFRISRGNNVFGAM